MRARSPRRVPPSHETPLPGDAAPLVGRVADREAVGRLFEDGARLVTITGLGGMGKTRVALRFASEQSALYSAHGGGGVRFCDLTAARSALDACAVVASAAGVRMSGSADEREVADDLGRALARRKRVLVVLDNFEGLAALAEVTLGRWTRAAPSARFLVTSRVALGLPGEHLWPLGPLGVPAEDERDPEHIAAADAVELFVRRARQVRPDLAPSASDLAAAGEIVRRLEGIPLAIELAAARVAVLSIPELRARLARRFELLVRRGDEGRHASMRRVLADSFEHLQPAEQVCLAGCSVFVGGFTLASAEAVLGDAAAPVLPALESLVARSLVRRTPCPDLGGDLRFSLFETIRELAAERLAAEPALHAEVVRRHAAHFAELGRALSDRAFVEGSDDDATRLAHELDNLVAAHGALVGPRDHAGGASSAGSRPPAADPRAAADAITIALAAAPLLARRGLFRLRLRLLDEALLRGAEAPVEDHLAARLARGLAHRELGSIAAARADFEATLALARAVPGERGDPRDGGPGARTLARLSARALMHLGELIEIDGATVEARARFAEALARLDGQAGDPHADLAEAEIRAHLGHAYRREGDLERAEAEIARAIALHRAAGRAEPLAMALYEAAVVALFRESSDEALARFEEALALARTRGARQAEGALSSGLGVLLQERGQLDRAMWLHTRAAEIFREVGNLHREASARYYLAGTYLERGQRSDAAALLDEALAIVRSLGVPRYEALIASCRATLFAAAGDPTRAAEAIEAAERAAQQCRTERTLALTVAIHKLYTAHVAGPPGDAADMIAAARDLAAAHAGDDPRFALRAVLACATAGARPGARPPLIVRPDGRAFRLPGSASDVNLDRRPSLRRVLLALARKRVESPTDGLALDELLAAGWPGERVRATAGANRVHVALTTLRNLGLRSFLRSRTTGYILSPDGPCELEVE